jgi:hypothetical protein
METTSNQEKDRYVGWVPCLTGQLVFGLVECGLQDSNYSTIQIKHICRDLSGSLVEYVLVHSTVDWKDFGDKDLKGLWSVVLLSKRNLDSKCHEGAVYLMLQGDKELNDVLEVAHKIKYKLQSREKVDIKSFSEFQQKIDSLCPNKKHFYKVDFNLEEDGVVWLSPFDRGYSKNDCRIIARQAYYYIKYAWHRHQHHNSRAETLTTVHIVRSNSRSSNEKVAKKLIEDLKRNLVTFKRRIDDSSHREVLRAKGIVSYTKALIEIMNSRSFIDSKYYEKELNHLSYFDESLDVISGGIEKNISMHNQAVNDARALILFVFAIITPALVVNRDKIISSYESYPIPNYVNWLGGLYSNGTAFLLFICTVGIFFTTYILLQTRYGNFLILMGCIKKAVAYIVADKGDNGILSKSNILSVVMVVLALIIVAFSLNGLFLNVLAKS